MDSANTKGNETSEFGVAKWIITIAGIAGTALTGLVAALLSAGTFQAGDPVAIVLGTIATVLIAVAGLTGKSYIDGRSEVKAAALRNVTPAP